MTRAVSSPAGRTAAEPADRRPGPRPRRAGASRRRAVAVGFAAVVIAAVTAGCASAPAPGSAQVPVLGAARPAAEVAPAHQAQPAAGASCDPEASSPAPTGPPAVTSGSYMAQIKKRGYLIAGVDQSTYHFGYLNPLDGQIEGFDIDMIQAVAQAIFGSPDKVQYKAISDAQRIPAVTSGKVDIVAHTMTITCDRLRQVSFSSVYFEAHQRVLVPVGSKAANGLAGLGGQKVCATEGSDSADTISKFAVTPKITVVQRPFWTDCLVLLQENEVAAVSTDDAILYGLAAQDPFTTVVGPQLTKEPYGLAMSRQHQDFVRFVNAVLAKDVADGGWEKSYKRWVNSVGATPPVARYAG